MKKGSLRVLLCLALLGAFPSAEADVRGCLCDMAKPETLEMRECSLCKEAEKRPEGEQVFVIRDNNPRKANRWLALPRKHYPGGHALATMPAEDRAVLWAAAIAKSKELWGDDWGVAMNGDQVRTQCHGHVHIGRMLDDVEYPGGVLVRSIPEIPVPPNGTGIWIHQSGAGLHVHAGEQITENVLMR